MCYRAGGIKREGNNRAKASGGAGQGQADANSSERGDQNQYGHISIAQDRTE